MLEIIEPRYKDRSVLLACYKMTPGYPVKVHIRKGAYAGNYEVAAKVVANSPTETMKTKAGAKIQMKAVPLDSLTRLEEA